MSGKSSRDIILTHHGVTLNALGIERVNNLLPGEGEMILRLIAESKTEVKVF